MADALVTARLEWLLRDICADWGFCLPADKQLAIAQLPQLDGHRFALAVLSAEGFDAPQHETQWLEKIAQRFIDCFGEAGIEP